MDVPGTASVAIDIDVGQSPIQGLLRTDGGPSRRFRGWLELTAALDAIATAPDGRQPGPDQQEDER